MNGHIMDQVEIYLKGIRFIAGRYMNEGEMAHLDHFLENIRGLFGEVRLCGKCNGTGRKVVLIGDKLEASVDYKDHPAAMCKTINCPYCENGRTRRD